MRSLRRWIRINYAEYRISGRLREIGNILAAQTGHKIIFERSGSRGQDSIYIVSSGSAKFGVLRLCNPWRKEKKIDSSMPYRLLPQSERLNREWSAYEKGAVFHLTPKPIWRNHDAILCEYVPLKTMHDYLLAKPENFWRLVMLASKKLSQLHEAGLIHMDASLANLLADDIMNHIVIIDFEFGPASHVTIEQQKAYDYLRLLESSLKFIPPGLNKEYQDWADFLTGLTHDYLGNIDLKPLLPALPRLSADPSVWPVVCEIFNNTYNP